MSSIADKPKYTGVDYCRYTDPSHDIFAEWDAALSMERVREEHAGRRTRTSSLLGYFGTKGEHYFIGKGEQGSMVQASGALAWSLWRTLGARANHCTRMDLQVTWPIDGEAGTYVRDQYEVAQMAPHREGRPHALQLTDTPEGAKMLTIGSRSSELYGRIYDKGRESKLPEYQNWVRWEVEVKGDQANDLDKWLRRDKMEIPHTRAIVCDYFTKRGVAPFWETYEAMFVEPPVKRARTDDTKIAWLASQVGPTIKTLREHGKLPQAIRALFGQALTDEQIEAILSAVYEEPES